MTRPTLLLCLVIGTALSAARLGAADAPAAVPASALYLNVSAPIEARVADLVSRMTLEEKAEALNHVGPTLARFNLRADQWNQCLNGVDWNRPTTLFPSCVGMAATWNVPLVKTVATVLSDEARAIYNGWHLDPNAPGDHKGLIYRAPVINIERNPYWGRNHEAWGEDPFLTGRMAVAYVQGLQGDDPLHLKIAATLKHYAVNNVETGRKTLNATVSERMLHEYWLPHFKEAIIEGGAESVMASYNAINGTHNNINHWLLTDVLKNEWHHDGFVVSDLGGVGSVVADRGARLTVVDAVAQSLMAGCDFSDKEFQANIPAAVQAGKLTLERLNDAVTRVLRVRMKLGDFDPFESDPYSRISPAVIDSAAHRAVALQVSQQSIVLLQNRASLLPLDRAKLKRIAVLGPLADQIETNNYNGKYSTAISPLQGLKDRAAPGVEIVSAVGATLAGAANAVAADLPAAVALARDADAAILFVGTNRTIEQENHDRRSLALPGNQEALVKAVVAANPRTIVVLMGAGPLTVPWLKDNVPAMIQAWWPGEEGGHAIADVLFGDVNPAGRLPHTVYASEAQVPPINEYDITKGFTYMYVNGAPLFPFGHGLSYTTFGYNKLNLSSGAIKADGVVNVSVEVANTGARAGDEVVQLYVHQVKSRVKVPAEELRGFRRVNLLPGEIRVLTFQLPAEKLAIWDETTHAFVVEPGTFEVMVGASSGDLRLRQNLEVTAN